jgi:paraquat-inducible protein B
MKKLPIIFRLSGILKTATALLVIAGLSACGSNGIEVTAQFRNAADLKEGAKVYFEERSIGQVIDIKQQDSVVIVTMMIEQLAAETIDSAAAVAVNRIKPGTPLEIYASASAQQFGLQEGQQLKGLNSMMELVAWSLGDAFHAGTGELTAYVDSFQEYLEGDEFEQDRARVEAGVKEMAAVATVAMKTVEQDLATAMAEMTVSEEELALAILQLGDELSPVAEEMAKSGTDLMIELEKFTQGLENATAEEQASGQQLIESLIATIEKLNQAAERGAQRSLDDIE